MQKLSDLVIAEIQLVLVIVAGGTVFVEGHTNKQQHLCDRSPKRLRGNSGKADLEYNWDRPVNGFHKKNTKALKRYTTKNNTEAEQAAFDDALF